jgi:hypothetical protein
MGLFASRPGRERRALPWLVALSVLLVLGGATVWARQQEAVRRSAEARADAAEAQLAVAEATITAIARAQAEASATALARANEPAAAVEHALSLVLATYKEPSEARLRALGDAFSPEALAVFRPEADRLISMDLRLGGESDYEVEVLSSAPRGADRAEVRTRERWTYDERDASGRRARCLREEGEQTYTLQRTSGGWLVNEVNVATSQRTEC